MKFIYTRSNDEIRIDQIEDPEAVIYVPEQFEDCPVTELGSMCWLTARWRRFIFHPM